MNSNLKVIPLAGVEEIGINCTVYEYQHQIIVVDMGLGFPDADMYGVDYLVPNVDYLVQNKQKVEGIFITHGHLDHIGALPYLLPKLDFPDVYGTEFTIELIKAALEDHKILHKAKLHVINHESQLASGNFKISFFRVNHSIPQCVGLLIETPSAKVVHTGDFKFDNSPVNEPVADYARIASIGQQGIDLLLADSTNSLRKGHPVSESDVALDLENVIEHAKGRVIVASFSGLVGRLYQLIQIAAKHNRKVAIAGFGMNRSLRIAEEIGYIKPPQGLIVPIQKINRYNDDKVLILTTGAQGEENAALFRMANDEYKTVKLKKGDTVVLSAGTIPGNHVAVQYLIDAISSKGAIVRQSENMDFYTSGHGYQEDQKIMLNLVKPNYFMPVHGYQYFLREHGRTAIQVGIKENHVIIAKRGNVIEGNSHLGFQINGTVKATPLLISGSGVGDVGEQILTERQQLGNNGVLVINANIDLSTKHVVGEPEILTRGFVYVKSSQKLLGQLQQLVRKTINSELHDGSDFSAIRSELQSVIKDFAMKETGRDPMLITVFKTVNGRSPKPKVWKNDAHKSHTSQPVAPTEHAGHPNGHAVI